MPAIHPSSQPGSSTQRTPHTHKSSGTYAHPNGSTYFLLRQNYVPPRTPHQCTNMHPGYCTACWLKGVDGGGSVVVEQRSTKKARLQFNDAGNDDDEPNNKKGSCAAAQTVELNWHKRLKHFPKFSTHIPEEVHPPPQLFSSSPSSSDFWLCVFYGQNNNNCGTTLLLSIYVGVHVCGVVRLY